jgi:hypothetical protein
VCPVGTERWAGVPGTRARAPPCARPAKDETSPVSTGAGTRRVQSVRHGGRDASSQYGRGGARPAHTARARGLARGVQVAARRAARGARRGLFGRGLFGRTFSSSESQYLRDQRAQRARRQRPPPAPSPVLIGHAPTPSPVLIGHAPTPSPVLIGHAASLGTGSTTAPKGGQGLQGRARAPRARTGRATPPRRGPRPPAETPRCEGSAARRVSGAKGQRREGSALPSVPPTAPPAAPPAPGGVGGHGEQQQGRAGGGTGGGTGRGTGGGDLRWEARVALPPAATPPPSPR